MSEVFYVGSLAFTVWLAVTLFGRLEKIWHALERIATAVSTIQGRDTPDVDRAMKEAFFAGATAGRSVDENYRASGRIVAQYEAWKRGAR